MQLTSEDTLRKLHYTDEVLMRLVNPLLIVKNDFSLFKRRTCVKIMTRTKIELLFITNNT